MTKSFKVPVSSRKMLPAYTDEQKTFLASRIGLTLEQLKRLQEAAHATYGAIGADLAEANGGKAIKRADLVEVVQDANHMEHFGLRGGWSENTRRLNQELLAWIKTERQKYKLEHVYEAVAAGFPYPAYE